MGVRGRFPILFRVIYLCNNPFKVCSARSSASLISTAPLGEASTGAPIENTATNTSNQTEEGAIILSLTSSKGKACAKACMNNFRSLVKRRPFTPALVSTGEVKGLRFTFNLYVNLYTYLPMYPMYLLYVCAQTRYQPTRQCGACSGSPQLICV